MELTVAKMIADSATGIVFNAKPQAPAPVVRKLEKAGADHPAGGARLALNEHSTIFQDAKAASFQPQLQSAK